MRSPVGAIVQGTTLTIVSGNQFQGFGNAANQLQDGSTVFFKRQTDSTWQAAAMSFFSQAANNKYYAAQIAANTFQTGDTVQYYLRIPYSDRDTTFLCSNDGQSVTTGSETAAQAAPFTLLIEDHALKGEWGPVFSLPNVAIHTHLLPDGRVLMWGRRIPNNDSLDVHRTAPFVWDPATGAATATANEPALADGTPVNLFCSGHAFLPDGRLLVVGGHQADGDGISQACLFDWRTNSFTPTAPMQTPDGKEVRRWYPTATALPDGTVLVMSGSYIDPSLPQDKHTIVADLLQIWDDGVWKTIDQGDGKPLNYIGLPLYPRLHLTSQGQVFMSGSNDRTLLLKTTTPGAWTELAFRARGNRDYCPALIYDTDRILYIGGGNDADSHAPTAGVERIDLGTPQPAWSAAAPLHTPRRQHNACVLPDGTVLVTGGTRGGGGANNGFNDLAAGEPVHVAELWDPSTDTWQELTAEDVDRCYHATALLLPDATVLSAGGGEYRPDNLNTNDPQDSHRDAQIFSPPYLFKGARPQISQAPSTIRYGQRFQIDTQQAAQIGRVTLISLASVTHAFNEHQSVQFLSFTASTSALDVAAPPAPSPCVPGHYMLFIVDRGGVPSRAAIVQLQALAPARAVAAAPRVARPAAISAALGAVAKSGVASPAQGRPRAYLQVYAYAQQIARAEKGTPVIVGITGTCPYGIGACWGGAYEALQRLEDVAFVAPIPNVADSTAEVFLKDDRLPPLDAWREQFRRIVNGSYELRGIEVSVRGRLARRAGQLFLRRNTSDPELRLDGLRPDQVLQWDHSTRARKPLGEAEARAHATLLYAAIQHADLVAAGLRKDENGMLTVTGPFELGPHGPVLHVRHFAPSPA